MPCSKHDTDDHHTGHCAHPSHKPKHHKKSGGGGSHSSGGGSSSSGCECGDDGNGGCKECWEGDEHDDAWEGDEHDDAWEGDDYEEVEEHDDAWEGDEHDDAWEGDDYTDDHDDAWEGDDYEEHDDAWGGDEWDNGWQASYATSSSQYQNSDSGHSGRNAFLMIGVGLAAMVGLIALVVSRVSLPLSMLCL